MLKTFYLSSFFPGVSLIEYVSSCHEMQSEPINKAHDKHQYRHKWGKIGPSYLLSENGDLSFLLFFSKQCVVENFQGKLKKVHR